MTDRQDNTRRHFLRTSAAVGGALASGLVVPGAYAAGNDVIKVGLIGCGGRGSGAAENICEAAGTSFNIKLHALADVFPDRVNNLRERLGKNEKTKERLDITDERCFTGFDGYKNVIESCDLIMLATPPGFRPQHIEATVKAGKHLFTEKPVSVDGPGTRKVLAAAEEAKKKNLAVVAGTQRRHQAGYIESLKRIHEGALGDLVTARVYWNQGNIWAIKRQPNWSDTEYQVRNWYHFLWLCGGNIVEQHVHNLDVANWAIGTHPIRAVGMGGRQVNTGPEFGESYDHFAVEYEYPNNVFVQSMCRQIAGCENNVSETIVGTKGQWQSGGYRFSGAAGRERIRVREVNPYVQEHIDLLTSIAEGKPLNELAQVAESTLTAVMGRMSAFTGKAVTWEQALNSQLDTFPKELKLDGPMSQQPIAMPGITELI